MLEFETGSARAVYAHLLNAKGRVMQDMILYKGLEKDEYILEVNQGMQERMKKFINAYNLEKTTKVSTTTERIAFLSSTDTLPENVDKNLVFEDPRTPEMGYRAIVDDNANISENLDKYTHYRYGKGVTEGANEIISGKSLPLIHNLDKLSGVSFTKGCYLGQELTQRTHFTGLVSKRVYALRGDLTAPLETPNGTLDLLKVKKRLGQIVEPIAKSPLDDDLQIAIVKMKHLDDIKSSKSVEIVQQAWNS